MVSTDARTLGQVRRRPAIAAIIATVVAAAVPWASGESVADVPSSEPTRTLPAVPKSAPSIVVEGASADQRAHVAAAIGRFEAAGLPLPDLRIEFAADEDCRGNLGYFDSAEAPWYIRVCSDLAFVVTHELAHAWAERALDDADRDAYVARRGLATWGGREIERAHRGVEDAAFVVQQNLMAGAVRVESDTWQDRIGAYEALTGQPSPLR